MPAFVLLLLALCFGTTASAQDDAIVRLFENHLRDDRFTSAYISPKMFEVMAEKVDIAMDEDVRKMIRQLRSMRVVQRNGEDGAPLWKPTTDKLQAARYEELMSLREKGEQVRFYTMGSGAKVKELVLVVAGPQRFLLLSMVGDIDLGTVAKLSRSLQFQGADLLEKVRK